MPGDYLYYNGRSFKLREGSWGILRVLDGRTRTVGAACPAGREPRAAGRAVCPVTAPGSAFDVAAIDAPLPMLDGEPGLIYVLQSQKGGRHSAGTVAPQPLVLHVNVGDCIRSR